MTPDSDSVSTDFKGYVVAVGASAGGLEALELFFQNMAPDTGAAFVIIQHLSPDHKSLMANLLARHTPMPVKAVSDGDLLAPNHVYLIPPGCLMTLDGPRLRLTPKNPRELSLPIDLFFNSAAESHGPRVVAVVLSGTGSDGTRGAVSVNAAGGLLLAQSPESCKFDGMPRSVIATGLVDEVLAPQTLGGRIAQHVCLTPRAAGEDVTDQPPALDASQAVEAIHQILHHVGGINFRDYKPATVMRRIERRMHVRHASDYENYLRLLENDRAEVTTLRRDILIPVTSFFRDPAAFETLAQTVIEELVKRHDQQRPIRVWVAGTSTGEEAYTLSILFAEAFERCRRWSELKIFATDVEQQNIETAGTGAFPESIASEVSQTRLERFFHRRGNHYVAKNEIRQCIVFARHNLLDDPPFTRMDLVTCRNTLIYFQPRAQENVLRRLQFALLPGGHLFLGPSESLGETAREFSAVSTRHKIFAILRPGMLPMRSDRDSALQPPRTSPLRTSRRSFGPSSDAAAIDHGHALLLRTYAPASVLLTARRELLHVYGDARRYLQFPQGSVTLDIAKLLHERLVPVALALLHNVVRERHPIRSEVLRLTIDAGEERLRLVARLAEDPANGAERALPLPSPEPYVLLSFEPEVPVGPSAAQPLDVRAETLERIDGLERELLATRESLQATVEELETANEELQATNEELMASNEELQSANEELQSVNEELYTVNAENQEKIHQMDRVGADLDALAKAATVAAVFVDERLRITRFTPKAAQFFKIQDGDEGRALDDFAHGLAMPTFMRELHSAIESGHLFELDIETLGRGAQTIRIQPYAVRASGVRGAVIVLIPKLSEP